MANNRLYLVDTETNEYICIASTLNTRWTLVNVNLFKEFLNDRDTALADKTSLIIGSENDDEFFDTHILNAEYYEEDKLYEIETRKHFYPLNLDFDLLRNQKKALLEMQNKIPSIPKKDWEVLEGILSLIDALQDYAVDHLGYNEDDVFLFEEIVNKKNYENKSI